MILRYEDLMKNPKRLLALTGLKQEEIEQLLPPFEAAWEEHRTKHHRAAESRKRALGGGRPGHLRRVEDKMLFMKPRLETPLLAAGRKAGPPEAGNQCIPLRIYPVLERPDMRYDHGYESASWCPYRLPPGVSLCLDSPLPSGDPYRESGYTA